MSDSNRIVYAVSELNEILRALVEDSLPMLWVEGEISNFSKPSSGHWYFTLKDGGAQIRCAMFRKANFNVRPPPREGDAVLVRARPGVYPARGELQLIVEHLEPAGGGALWRAFEDLKQRLMTEGLFDAAIKKPIPRSPRAIGLITSATGAAIHDVLSTLARRWPLGTVYVYPVPVQGVEAPGAIVRALDQLPKRAEVDLVLLVRGGGSIEDLWAFNDERVARAIRACQVPVICGVGHEVDSTIADFSADLRAPTPTAAAELASVDIADSVRSLERCQRQLQSLPLIRIGRLVQRAESASDRLLRRSPERRLLDRAQRLDEITQRLAVTIHARNSRKAGQLANAAARLLARPPRLRILRARSGLLELEVRAGLALKRRLESASDRLMHRAQLLESLSPRAVLARGYAIARTADGQIVRSVANLERGALLEVLLAKGRIISQVRELNEE